MLIFALLFSGVVQNEGSMKKKCSKQAAFPIKLGHLKEFAGFTSFKRTYRQGEERVFTAAR